MQLLRSESAQAKDNRQNEVAEISRGIKALAKELGIPIVVLRRDFIVACFNRAAADVLSLAELDVGYSPNTISILSGLPKLERWCAEVISTDVPAQHDVRIADRSFIIRIAPYTNGQISGTVLTFTNVTAFRASINQAIYEREYTKAILNTAPDPLVAHQRRPGPEQREHFLVPDPVGRVLEVGRVVRAVRLRQKRGHAAFAQHLPDASHEHGDRRACELAQLGAVG